jgi:hypothetical protein
MHEEHGGEYLTPQELTQRYKGVVTLRTLANWRSTGEGPQFTKIGGRVLYALLAVKAWEARRRIGTQLAVAALSGLFLGLEEALAMF